MNVLVDTRGSDSMRTSLRLALPTANMEKPDDPLGAIKSFFGMKEETPKEAEPPPAEETPEEEAPKEE